jgi:methyl-accepting chemotaxis protein
VLKGPQSLSLKIILPISAILVVVFGCEAAWQWRARNAELTDSLNLHAQETSAVVESTLRHAMLAADLEAIDSMMTGLGRLNGVKRLFVVDRSGKVFRSSDPTMTGKVEQSAIVQRALKSNGNISELTTGVDNRPFVVGVTAVRAQAGCAQCHRDVKVGEPIGYLALERWATKESDALQASQLRGIAVSVAVVLLLGFALSFVARQITKPLASITKAAARIAQGDIDQEVTDRSNDELGRLADSFRSMITYIREVAQGADALSKGDARSKLSPKSDKDVLTKSFIQLQTTIRDLTAEANKLAEWARDGDLNRRGNEKRFDGAFRDLVQGMNQMVEAVSKPINESTLVLQRVAKRDVSARMQGSYKGQYATIKDALNTATQNLDNALADVSVASEQVAAASAQIETGNQSLAAAASQQAGSLEEVSGALNEMAAKAKQNTFNASEARSISGDVRVAAERGAEHMGSLSQAMNRIKASADSTARVVKTIEEIAFQTNLLALNASVEAARAGDAGKGFAVVADEVRNLAIRSAEAAKNTALLIEESVRNADGGVQLNQLVITDLQDINSQVRKVTGVMAEIVQASEQQSRGVEQINAAVAQMNHGVQRTAANSEETASATTELTSQAQALQDMVGTFTISPPAASSGPAKKKSAPISSRLPSDWQPAYVAPPNRFGRIR